VKSVSLLIVFVLAKIAVLWGRPIAWWSWTVAAYFWQDVLIAASFGLIEWSATRARLRSRAPVLGYAALAAYAALNVPVAIVLSTPLTWPMLRATSGTLADSILLYATPRNTLLVLLTLAAASVLPRVLTWVPGTIRPIGASIALLIVAIGPAAASRVDTIGLDRNVVVALVASTLPHVDAHPDTGGEWTSPPFESHETDDLAHLRGLAAGRNVVLVSLESTAAQYLRLYGGKDDVTPHLDLLARQAIVFENAYAVYPESIKGLFSILCSTFPAFDTTPEIYEGAPCRSIAAVLAQAGYRTGLFHSGRFAYLGMRSIVSGRGYQLLEDAGDIGGHHESSFGVDETSTVSRMLSWIDSRPAGDRFFLTYLPIAGHHPYETPDDGPFEAADERGRYRNALHYADQSLGALIAGVRARGLDQSTIWIVLGDHGEAFGQHDGNYGHTFFLYDENVRVPFLVAAPGIVDRRQHSRTTVSLVDTAPTILDLLGVPHPPEYQGHSALDGRSRMALFFTDYSLPLVGLRDGRWKFVHELESGRSKLFDIDRDAGERTDVSGLQASRVAAYERGLRAWSAAQKSHLINSGRKQE
jgi:glucan phosphoethanolaminetransferase (alkaline phosphatase superfamily)